MNKSDWISVDDRLPESEVDVLVVASGKPSVNITVVNSPCIAFYDECEREWIMSDFGEWADLRVTHWMPLPELPEGLEKMEGLT